MLVFISSFPRTSTRMCVCVCVYKCVCVFICFEVGVHGKVACMHMLVYR